MEKRLMAVCIVIMLDLCLFVMAYDSESRTDKSVSAKYYENVVALTFDDGPHPVYTRLLLEGLESRGAKATFFVVGERIAGNEDIIEAMKEQGHLIGNHTFTHIQLDKVNQTAACCEISKTNSVLEDITGEKVVYLRPPYGSYNAQLECGIDMTEVLWTLDPQDWEVKNVDAIVKDVVSNVKDGDIILLHDIYDTSVAAALRIVDELQAKGYVFVTVDDILIK